MPAYRLLSVARRAGPQPRVPARQGARRSLRGCVSRRGSEWRRRRVGQLIAVTRRASPEWASRGSWRRRSPPSKLRVLRRRCLPLRRRRDHALARGGGGEAAREAALGRRVAAAAVRSLLGDVGRRDHRRRDRLGIPKACSRSRRRWSSSSTTSSGETRRSSTWAESNGAALAEQAPILLLCMARPDAARPAPRLARRLAARAAARRAGRGADAAIRPRDELRGADRVRVAAGHPSHSSPRCWRSWRRTTNVERAPDAQGAPGAARFDQLDEHEAEGARTRSSRGQRSSTAGPCRRSYPGGIAAEATRLAGLVRRELIRPDRAQLARRGRLPLPPLCSFPGGCRLDEAPCPRRSPPTSTSRFADSLAQHGLGLVEVPTRSIGYHLRSAGDPFTSPSSAAPSPDLCERAAERLAAAGRRAKDRLDGRAATSLLTRAAELLRPHRLDVALELEAAWVTNDLDGRAAVQAADALADRAAASVTCPVLRLPVQQASACV